MAVRLDSIAAAVCGRPVRWKLRLSATTAPVPGRLQDVRRRSQSNEEDRYMPKSDMNGTEGEITAIYRGGVRHAEV
jgi:hypothetical protein